MLESLQFGKTSLTLGLNCHHFYNVLHSLEFSVKKKKKKSQNTPICFRKKKKEEKNCKA